jgi:hypothetical protein
VQAQHTGSPGGDQWGGESRWARSQGGNRLHELNSSPWEGNTTRPQAEATSGFKFHSRGAHCPGCQRTDPGQWWHALGNDSELQQTAHITIGSRELEQGIGRQWATVLGTKFYGAGTPGAPGSGPGGEYVGQQLGEIFTPQTAVTMAVHPSSSPDIVRSWSSAGRENTEARCGPAGPRAHQYCFGFIC